MLPGGGAGRLGRARRRPAVPRNGHGGGPEQRDRQPRHGDRAARDLRQPGRSVPTGIPVGSNEIHVPEPTPDAGLACVRAAALPPNAIRVVVLHGQRSLGTGPEGWPLPDLSEPTEEAGWTEVVDGRPARLTIESGVPGRPAEMRTWDVLQPGSLENVTRIRADIAGPDLDAGRAIVQRIIDGVDFKAAVTPIDEANAADVLRDLLDGLERSARESASDFYSCFPREPWDDRRHHHRRPGRPPGRLARRALCDSVWETSPLEPTLLVGDFVAVNKFAYGFRLPIFENKVLSVASPKTGEIAVFRWPPNPSYDYIKRVIGVPGDKLSYRNKILTINGKEMQQKFIEYTVDESSGKAVAKYSENLNGIQHYIYVRPEVPAVDFEVEVPKGHYFMMGDNRDDSADSRYWGFTSDEYLRGKALLVWMSWNSKIKNVRWSKIGQLINKSIS